MRSPSALWANSGPDPDSAQRATQLKARLRGVQRRRARGSRVAPVHAGPRSGSRRESPMHAWAGASPSSDHPASNTGPPYALGPRVRAIDQAPRTGDHQCGVRAVPTDPSTERQLSIWSALALEQRLMPDPGQPGRRARPHVSASPMRWRRRRCPVPRRILSVSRGRFTRLQGTRGEPGWVVGVACVRRQLIGVAGHRLGQRTGNMAAGHRICCSRATECRGCGA
jgi:hypothetical protein